MTYDVTRAGERFLVGRPVGVDPAPPIAVIQNWRGLIKP